MPHMSSLERFQQANKYVVANIYLAQNETQQIYNDLISCHLVKTIRLNSIMLICMTPTRILCIDLNNGQITFKLRKDTFQGHGPADHDLNKWVIRN